MFALDIARLPNRTPIHELERSMATVFPIADEQYLGQNRRDSSGRVS